MSTSHYRTMSFAELLARQQATDRSTLRRSVRIFSNINLSNLSPILECALADEGVGTALSEAPFDNAIQDALLLAMGESPAIDCAFVHLELGAWSESFHLTVERLTDDELETLTESMKSMLRTLLGALERVPQILFSRFSALPFTQGARPYKAADLLALRLNSWLDSLGQRNLVLLSTERLFAELSLDRCLDMRMWRAARSLYSLDFLRGLTEMAVPYLRDQFGKVRKVLVVDCDNTLWGGVVGETGALGIEVGATSPRGKIFYEIQQRLAALSKRGVILAIASKNNPEDVKEVFAVNHDMVLTEEDFAVQMVSWDNKPESIRAIAKKLNLGLDSFAFLDDSSFELGQVEAALPEVRTFLVPENTSRYPALMNEIESLFFRAVITDEDRTRTVMYRQDQERTDESGRFSSVDDFLKSLDLMITIHKDPADHSGRLEQLSQRTNQFNLSTKRYTESEILGMIGSPETTVFSLEAADRFGNYGICGLAIVRADRARGAELDSFLLSCRVLGRKIEDRFLEALLEDMHRGGYDALKATYIRTAKNAQTAGFFDRFTEQPGTAAASDETKSWTISRTSDVGSSAPLIRLEWR